MAANGEEDVVFKRITSLINFFEGGVQTRFAERVGIPTGIVGSMLGKKRTKPGFELTGKILQAYPRVSERWLLLGEGEMLKSETRREESYKIQASAERQAEAHECDSPPVAHGGESAGLNKLTQTGTALYGGRPQPTYGRKPDREEPAPALPITEDAVRAAKEEQAAEHTEPAGLDLIREVAQHAKDIRAIREEFDRLKAQVLS